MNMNQNILNMELALNQADKALQFDEVPIGAVLINNKNELISEAHNLKESNNDPCGHAEVLVLIAAAKKLKGWRLSETTIYVTLEPCPMCLSAMVQARIKCCVFGAYDPKGGALSLGYNLYKDKRLNHNFDIIGGVKHLECSTKLSNYFKSKRKRT